MAGLREIYAGQINENVLIMPERNKIGQNCNGWTQAQPKYLDNFKGSTMKIDTNVVLEVYNQPHASNLPQRLDYV
jgi:hypothetical protein